jgi:hypothetical protein
LVVWLGLLLWGARDHRDAGPHPAFRRRDIFVVLAATVAAPAYYACLSHVDYSWSQFSQMDAANLMITGPVLEYCLVPLVVVTVVCVWGARRDRSARSLIVWALATLAVVALRLPEQYHALDGLAFPLGLLAVRSWPATRRLSIGRLTAIAGVAAIAATFAFFAASSLRFVQSPAVTTYSELAPSDVRAVAIAALADGGRPILSPGVLGSAIPMLADAPTWAGNLFWTPGGGVRSSQANALFQGWLAPHAARRFVLFTRARALVQPCGWSVPLEAALAPLGFRERVVGCARVYVRGG